MSKVKTENERKAENKERSKDSHVKHVRKYKYSELFQETPSDHDNVLFLLPDEITEEADLSVGDLLDVDTKGSYLVFIKPVDDQSHN